MEINSDIEIIDIDTKKELGRYWEGISKLFLQSFGKPLDKQLWDWAYQSNPNGDPLISIAVCNDDVVGHYAVIPLKLSSTSGDVAGYLSMTTMVAPEFRRHKLFQGLAERVYSRIELKNRASVVFGFPNDNSAPGFAKKLGWTISEEYAVVSVLPGQIDAAKNILEQRLLKSDYKLDLSAAEIRSWRMKKPNQAWRIVNGLGLKQLETETDLMFIETAQDLEGILGAGPINMILPINEGQEFNVAFSYRFGYRTFNMSVTPNFFVEMAMSDIF